jgi:hypothetical protein
MSATGRMAAPTRAMSSRPAPQLHQPPRLNRVVETPLLLLPPGSVPAEHLRNSLHHRRRRAPSWITSTPISAAAAVDPQTGEQNPQQSSQGEGQSLSGAVDVGSAPCWTDELDEVQRQVSKSSASLDWMCICSHAAAAAAAAGDAGTTGLTR